MALTKEEIQQYMREVGREGGKARAKKLSKPERKRIAAEAAKARWTRQRKGGTQR